MHIKPWLMLLTVAAVIPGVQAATIDTLVTADVDHLGDVTYQTDARATPGSTSACAELFMTPFCGDQLDFTTSFASSYAYTDYGTNRAAVYARSLGDETVSTAQATSFWSDELTFSGVIPGEVVVLRFHLDGSWNDASVDFQLGVFDPTLPYLPQEQGAPFSDYGHPIEMAAVASATFNTEQMLGLAISSDVGIVQTTIPSGTMEDGAISWDFELHLRPEDGVTYTLASVLGLTASILDVPVDPLTDPTPFGSSAEADFDSTAALLEIVLPAGVTVTSASGAAYNVTAVPEADTWAMLLAGLGFVGWTARWRRS